MKPPPVNPVPMPEPFVLTLPETARELRCSRAHLHNIIAGRIRDLPPLPVLRLGRRVLIRYEALRQWLTDLECRETEAQHATGFFGVR
jgi:Helix-turn-helix domain